jgi:hypothetical protein
MFKTISMDELIGIFDTVDESESEKPSTGSS